MNESLLDLAPAYALGALDAGEARAFEAAMASSPELAAAAAEYREVSAMLALAPEVTAPRASLRTRVIQGTPSDAPAITPISTYRAPRVRHVLIPWLAAAAGVTLAVFAWGAHRSGERRLAVRDSVLTATEAALAGRDSLVASLLAPGVETFQLTASGSPDPVLQLFWDRARHRAVVHGLALPSLPAGQVYQLWFIHDGAPMPSVTFRPGPDGRSLVSGIDVPATPLTAAAVTAEPEGGSAAPTSPVLYLVTLSAS